jgi:hypothetical protein
LKFVKQTLVRHQHFEWTQNRLTRRKHTRHAINTSNASTTLGMTPTSARQSGDLLVPLNNGQCQGVTTTPYISFLSFILLRDAWTHVCGGQIKHFWPPFYSR